MSKSQNAAMGVKAWFKCLSTFWTEVLSLTSFGGCSPQAIQSCLSRGDTVKPPTCVISKVFHSCRKTTRNEMVPWKTHLFVISSSHSSVNQLGFVLICKDPRLARANWTHWAFGHIYPLPVTAFPRHISAGFAPLVSFLPPLKLQSMNVQEL